MYVKHSICFIGWKKNTIIPNNIYFLGNKAGYYNFYKTIEVHVFLPKCSYKH